MLNLYIEGNAFRLLGEESTHQQLKPAKKKKHNKKRYILSSFLCDPGGCVQNSSGMCTRPTARANGVTKKQHKYLTEGMECTYTRTHQLPWRTSVLDRGQRRRPRAAVVPGHLDHVRVRLGDSRRHRPDSHLGHLRGTEPVGCCCMYT